MSVGAAFRRLHGRPPTDEEERRLLHVQEALGLRENDAFWYIILTLDHYDVLYGRHIERMQRETERMLREARERTAAGRPRGQPGNIEPAASCGPAPEHWQRFDFCTVGIAAAALIVFGSLCMAAGFSLAEGGAAS